MSRKTLSLILIIVGAIGLIAAVLGGVVGFPHPGFGYFKISAAVVGAIMVAAGILLSTRAKKA